MRSALYEGVVVHRRHEPFRHVFRRRLGWIALDLDELDRVFRGRWLWGVDRARPVSFRRRDHLGPPDEPLAASVRGLVAERTGARPRGPVLLLTTPRQLGFSFNPVSFFYCFDRAGEDLEAVVAEVTNTPWNERHCYALDVRGARRAGPLVRVSTPKSFHVSPFMGMDHRYEWTLRAPGRRLSVGIRSLREGRCVFDATLALERREIDGRSLAGALVRFPLQGVRTLAGIYLEALRLHRRGAPFHPHPHARPAPKEVPTT